MSEEEKEDSHIHWAPPSSDDVTEHDAGSRCRLESPPPPIDATRSLSPTPHSKIITAEAPPHITAPIAKYPSTVDSSNKSTSTSVSFQSKQLRGNLTREQKNRDPMLFYEVSAVLGIGSMGSVAKVRKRGEAVGGSARVYNQERVKREQMLEKCWKMPVVGGFFRNCIGSKIESLVVNRDILDQMSQDGKQTSSADITYALKSIHLSRVTDPTFIEELKNEISILKRLDHPHIVRAIETFEHRQQIFVIMELCSGGDLYTRDPYSEEEAARITSSILSAISYMHANNILHRDLKYENILFVNDSPQAEVKLIDFGLSKKFANEELTEGVGTIYTMAPEVLRGSYTEQADLWSLGVITFMLLSSQMPFYGRKKQHIIEQIMAGKFEFKGRRWKKISRPGKAFVQDLLVVDPEDRATADEAFKASWLNRRLGVTVRNALEEEIGNAKSSVIRFSNYTKLQRMALMVIAHKSTSEEIGILRKLFEQYDTQRDGELSFDEFKAAIQEAGYTEDDYREIFDAVVSQRANNIAKLTMAFGVTGFGRNRENQVHGVFGCYDGKTVVTSWMFFSYPKRKEAHGVISEDRLAEAFDRLDADDSGYISASNLAEMLGDDFPRDEIKAIIKEVSQDGKVSYPNFLALWEDRKEKERAKVMKEIDIPGSNSWDHSQASDVSVLSDECDYDNEDTKSSVLARASFLEGKQMSERKVAPQVTVDFPNPEEKHVNFDDLPVVIPEVPETNGVVLTSDV